MTEPEWLNCTDPAVMLEWLRNPTNNPRPYCNKEGQPFPSDRKLRLFACACCRRIWHLLTDERSQRVVEAAERYADALITKDELAAAREAAWGAAWAAAREAAWAAAREAAWGAARDAAWTAAREAARTAAREAARTAAREAARTAAREAEQKGQAALFRDIFGNPFDQRFRVRWGQVHEHAQGAAPRVPRWLTWHDGIVVKLAQAAYQERADHECQRCQGMGLTPRSEGGYWDSHCSGCGGSGRISDGTLDADRLAVIADALEEAGCTDEAILRHLRGWERCWMCVRTNSDSERDVCSVCGQLGAVGPFGRPCAPGWVKTRHPHVRGCWVLDLLLGKE